MAEDAACKVRAYENAGCECDSDSTCSDMSDSSSEYCCGTSEDYCNVEWTTTGAWINMDDSNCRGSDFFRISEGCGGIKVATDFFGAGDVYTYNSSVYVCGGCSEDRNVPGCDNVKSIYSVSMTKMSSS